MQEEYLYKKAKKRVKAKKGFIMHFSVFVAVMLFLFFINLTLTPGFNWAMIALLGWGIGIVAHFVNVFGFFGLGGKDWEQREMEKEMGKLDSSGRIILDDDRLDLNEPMEHEKRWDEDELV